MKSLLIIDDNTELCEFLSVFLKKNHYLIYTAFSGIQGIRLLEKHKPDLVLCDYRLPDLNGEEIINYLKEKENKIPLIVITAYPEIKKAIELIKKGAADYLTKPFNNDELLYSISKNLKLAEDLALQIKSKNQPVENNTVSFRAKRGRGKEEEIVIGQNPKVRQLFRQIDLVAPTNMSVMITGESGTGKEVIARAIHRKSSRNGNPFVAVDCGAIPKELAASELFGHEKGAFTGALVEKTGYFEFADKGTLFLDEIGNLPSEIQITLLRVLQEKKIRKIGNAQLKEIDIRLITATNEPLEKATEEGKFREDLFFRINEFSLHLPSLRERKEDIKMFADFFLKKANDELNKNISGFSPEVINIFNEATWRGNLREMQNIIKRAVLLSNGSEVKPESLPFEFATSQLNPVLSDYVFKESNQLKNAGFMAEHQSIMEVLKQTQFNRTETAKILNIDRKTLYNKMKVFEKNKGNLA